MACEIKKLLKLNGLILAPDAAAYLASTFTTVSADVVKRFVDCVLSAFALDDNRVTKVVCEQILANWNSASDTSGEVLFLIKALDVPRFRYCRNAKKFVPLRASPGEDVNSLLSSSPLSKSFLFAHRYEVVYQRVTRNPLFSDENGFKLRPVDFILASGGKRASRDDMEEEKEEEERDGEATEMVIVLGVLVQLRNAQWYLEDPTNLVKLDLSNTRFHQGIFSEGAIVLAEGYYDDNAEVFRATGIGLPPVECAAETRKYFSVTNPFGGESLDAPAAPVDQKMSRLLDASPDSMLVLLGETHLDVTGCLEHLETIFTGYADFPPCAFLLCGDFISDGYSPHISEKRALLKRLFKRLTDIFLRVYGDVEKRGYRQPRLVLIPGPNDPCVGPQGIYPRPQLPLDLFGMEERGASSTDWLWLATNPCRLRVFTREVVVFRYDYGRHLIRYCIHLPAVSSTSPADVAVEPASFDLDAETQQLEDREHGTSTTTVEDVPAAVLGRGLARCLSSQGHLTPLPLHVSPVYWAYDQSLCLNPLPDLVVAVEPDAIADLNVASASIVCGGEDPLGGCRFVNPGRFGSEEYTFKVYYPSNRLVEDSRVSS
ncbi:DNA polymerase epsilon subunit 2 [Taenia crassiceps]|uniref:DNA polymerase II subunit 2 n=1 Tax=Taenia crassiceps TaxID=6207 RepID=A0ABR4Q1U4_9CEST